jgi:hypothetical protein
MDVHQFLNPEPTLTNPTGLGRARGKELGNPNRSQRLSGWLRMGSQTSNRVSIRDRGSSVYATAASLIFSLGTRGALKNSLRTRKYSNETEFVHRSHELSRRWDGSAGVPARTCRPARRSNPSTISGPQLRRRFVEPDPERAVSPGRAAGTRGCRLGEENPSSLDTRASRACLSVTAPAIFGAGENEDRLPAAPVSREYSGLLERSCRRALVCRAKSICPAASPRSSGA